MRLLTLIWFLVAIPALGSDITLGWDRNAEAVAGYRVYQGVASRAYTNSVDAGNVTSNHVSGLVGGIQYFFAATAYDAIGLESDYSNEAAYRAPLSRPVIARPNVEIFVTRFEFEESEDLLHWASVGIVPVFLTLPLDLSKRGKFYRVRQLDVGRPITIAMTL